MTKHNRRHTLLFSFIIFLMMMVNIPNHAQISTQLHAQNRKFSLMDNDREILIYNLRGKTNQTSAPNTPATNPRTSPSTNTTTPSDSKMAKMAELGAAISDILADQIRLLPFVQTKERLKLFSFSGSTSNSGTGADATEVEDYHTKWSARRPKTFGYSRFTPPVGVSNLQRYARLRSHRLDEALSARQESGIDQVSISSDYRLSGSVMGIAEQDSAAKGRATRQDSATQRGRATQQGRAAQRKRGENQSPQKNQAPQKVVVSLLLFNENTGEETSFQETIDAPILDHVDELAKRVVSILAGAPLIDLEIKGEPQGQLVYFNDVFFGEIPIRRWFPLGIYDMEIRSDKGAWLSQKMDLARLAKGKSSLSLFYKMSAVANQVQVTIESEPTGAQVYLDEEYLGITPLRFTRPAGTSWLRLRLGGYQEYLEELTLQHSQSAEPNATPNAAPNAASNAETKKLRKIYLKPQVATSGPYAEDYSNSAKKLLYAFLGFYGGWLYFTIEGNRFASQTGSGSAQQAQVQYNLANISAGIGLISLIASSALFIVALDSDKHRGDGGESAVSLRTHRIDDNSSEYRATYHTSF